MKKNNKKKKSKKPEVVTSADIRYNMALCVADALASEVEALRIRGDRLAVHLATKSSKSDEVSHSLVKEWWEVRRG